MKSTKALYSNGLSLDLLARLLPKSRLVKGSVIAFDGFTGFTPVQNRVLRQLMELAQEVIVTAVLDGSEDMYDEKEEQNLFHLSKKTVASLTRLAAEAGVARGEDVILRDNPVPRFRDNPSMAHLEKQDRKSTRLNSSHSGESRMPSSA